MSKQTFSPYDEHSNMFSIEISIYIGRIPVDIKALKRINRKQNKN